MNLDLTGKTAVVCGSTQGIGFATATELANMGARVFLVARNHQALEEAKRHNRSMEAVALGRGMVLAPYRSGCGLFLNSYKAGCGVRRRCRKN